MAKKRPEGAETMALEAASDTNGNLAYNQKLSVPVKLKEDTVTRRSVAQGQDDRIEQQLTLTLTNDTLAQAATIP